MARKPLEDSVEPSHFEGRNGQNIVCTDERHNLLRVRGDHPGQSLQAVIGKIAANAKIPQIESVSQSLLYYGDPIECLALSGRAAGTKTSYHNRWLRIGHWICHDLAFALL